MNTPLWEPSRGHIQQANLTAFQNWLQQHIEAELHDYADLHRWSIDNSEKFWSLLWDYCGIIGDKGQSILSNGQELLNSVWFEDSQLNFAENLLANRSDKIAIVSRLENGSRRSLSYKQLFSLVAKLSYYLTSQGIGKGDRIAGFLPNTAEAVIGMLAASSIGAIWTSCSPDFGINGVIDRFGQTKPKILIACNGYFYNGKTIDSLPLLTKIRQSIDSIEQLLLVSITDDSNGRQYSNDLGETVRFSDAINNSAENIEFERLPFNHPLYIMYSSGTTGVPKCIVHGAGGTLLQHLKEHRLHTDLKIDDVFFYFTTCGWMMWNWLVSGLASEATLVLYDGSPFFPDANAMVDMIDEETISIFGTSAKFITSLEKAGIKPRESHKLEKLKSILSTGSPLSPESFEYVYRDFKSNVCLSSISGGTDIISCFALGNPSLPVWPGEIQCSGLGMAVEIWDDQESPIKQRKGELVCCKSFPSKPIKFWNDPEQSKFHSAYFEKFNNIWNHGDYGEITEHNGIIIHGRSDAVLNPGGVRIGTAEVYRQVEKIDEVIDSICVGQDWHDDVRVVLFVVLREGIDFSEELLQQIKSVIRKETTPRHVPAVIAQVKDIPRTISGKIVELAVRNCLHDQSVNNTDALANPEALDQFRIWAKHNPPDN
jgi:acetoacetyl-CoA synthetase